MSTLLVYSIKDNINYEELVNLSKKLVYYCLDKNLGVIFNFLGYSEDLINQLDSNLYFTISDDFLQLNCEYITTSRIENIEKEEGKWTFLSEFSVLDDIYNMLIAFGLKNISLLISCDGSVTTLEEFKVKKKGSLTITEILYKSIIEEKDMYAYDLPNIIITSI